LFEFDSLHLNSPERDAWARFVAKAGASGAAAVFDLMAHWVLKLLRDGKTPSQIEEKVVGTFYDSVTLMNRGEVMRSETITLAKAMVEQAIDAAVRTNRAEAEALASAPMNNG
jgi:hypothetical protein